MKRRRVDGVDDDELPIDEEVETQLMVPLVVNHAAIESVGGRLVARILGIADVTSVHHDEAHFAGVFHFAVLGLSLKDASHMVKCLCKIRMDDTVWIGNLPALLQARDLQSVLSHLSTDFCYLHEGLRRNSIIWEFVDSIRAMAIPPFNLQPWILCEGINALYESISVTVADFPAEPADRHAGPNTKPPPAYAAETYKQLDQLVEGHLIAIDQLFDIPLHYPDVPPDSFVVRVVEQLEEEKEESHCIRGLDHLQLMLAKSPRGTEFCLTQFYLGDADAILHAFKAASPRFYIFTNSDCIEVACEVRNTVMTMSKSLRSIADRLKAGVIDSDNIAVLEELGDKFLRGAMRQSLTGAFRAAAFQLNRGIMNLLDLTDVAQTLPPPAALIAPVEDLLRQMDAIWGISIHCPQVSVPEIFVPKEQDGMETVPTSSH